MKAQLVVSIKVDIELDPEDADRSILPTDAQDAIRNRWESKYKDAISKAVRSAVSGEEVPFHTLNVIGVSRSK